MNDAEYSGKFAQAVKEEVLRQVEAIAKAVFDGALFSLPPIVVSKAEFDAMSANVKQHVDVITAEQVRRTREQLRAQGSSTIDTQFISVVRTLEGLLSHPGVNSAARAVIEAALE